MLYFTTFLDNNWIFINKQHRQFLLCNTMIEDHQRNQSDFSRFLSSIPIKQQAEKVRANQIRQAKTVISQQTRLAQKRRKEQRDKKFEKSRKRPGQLPPKIELNDLVTNYPLPSLIQLQQEMKQLQKELVEFKQLFQDQQQNLFQEKAKIAKQIQQRKKEIDFFKIEQAKQGHQIQDLQMQRNALQQILKQVNNNVQSQEKNAMIREIQELKLHIRERENEKQLLQQQFNRQFNLLNETKSLKQQYHSQLSQQLYQAKNKKEMIYSSYVTQIQAIQAQINMLMNSGQKQNGQFNEISQKMSSDINTLTNRRMQLKRLRQQNGISYINQIQSKNTIISQLLAQIQEIQRQIADQQMENNVKVTDWQINLQNLGKQIQLRQVKANQARQRQTNQLQKLQVKEKQLHKIIKSFQQQQKQLDRTSQFDTQFDYQAQKKHYPLFSYGKQSLTIQYFPQSRQVWVGMSIKNDKTQYFTRNGVRMTLQDFKNLPTTYFQLTKAAKFKTSVKYFAMSKMAMIRDWYKGLQYYSLRQSFFNNGYLQPTKLGWNLRPHQMLQFIDKINHPYKQYSINLIQKGK